MVEAQKNHNLGCIRSAHEETTEERKRKKDSTVEALHISHPFVGCRSIHIWQRLSITFFVKGSDPTARKSPS